MYQLIINVPESLMRKLQRWAAWQRKKVDEVVLERLSAIPELEEQDLYQRYIKFIQSSKLFIKPSEEEKQRFKPVSEERLKELAAKLEAAGPLSQVITEERGEV